MTPRLLSMGSSASARVRSRLRPWIWLGGFIINYAKRTKQKTTVTRPPLDVYKTFRQLSSMDIPPRGFVCCYVELRNGAPVQDCWVNDGEEPLHQVGYLITGGRTEPGKRVAELARGADTQEVKGRIGWTDSTATNHLSFPGRMCALRRVDT